MFFRTERGAHVGDVYMSLGYSAVLAGANPLAYLTALLDHAEPLAANPAQWMPWNYADALAALPAN